MKTLLLAPRSDGKQPETIGPETRTVIIVGANGAGKTRFAEYISNRTPGHFNISALHALYDTRHFHIYPGSIDSAYRESTLRLPSNPSKTEFERLLALILQNGDDFIEPILQIWNEIFPQSTILVEAGKLLASNHGKNSGPYAAGLLSSGEKAVLYIIGALLFAPLHATLFIESPEIFLNPALAQNLWNRMERLRTDCRFVYITHSLDFASSRLNAPMVWVQTYHPAEPSWQYETLPPGSEISEPVCSAILGERKPVIFIEGDAVHSIDARLYPLIFPECTVRPLGSCNKVIEATRTFNSLSQFHHLDSHGIVDRDRRDKFEVDYLRSKKILVPDVAEIENLLLLPEVIEAVAEFCGKNPQRVLQKVKNTIFKLFKSDLRQQALLHTRHMVKHTVERRIDQRFPDIDTLELHLLQLPSMVNPRAFFKKKCREFENYINRDSYTDVLRVYNQKSMLPSCNVAGLCGLHDKQHYIDTILHLLVKNAPQARKIRTAIKKSLGLEPAII